MAKVIAFGDSFTWGSDMSDTVRADLGLFDPTRGVLYDDTYSRKTWQALLAQHMNYDYECHAVEGCSNQTIVRQFFDKLDNIKQTDLVIVSFTWRDRYDFLNEDTLKWESIRPSSTNNKFAELYYKHIQNNYWDNIESLKAINLLVGVLRDYNLPFIVTCIDEMIYNDNVHVNDTITALRGVYCNEIEEFDGMGFHHWAKHNNYPISPGWHPLEDAHEAAFEYMKEQKGL